MNLRTKITRLEARVPPVPDAEIGQVGRLLRRLCQFLTREERVDLARRAQCGETPFPLSGSPRIEDEIAALEAKWRREGRELPEYAWVDRRAWGVE